VEQLQAKLLAHGIEPNGMLTGWVTDWFSDWVSEWVTRCAILFIWCHCLFVDRLCFRKFMHCSHLCLLCILCAFF
jgi:hypothetical protein